MLAVSPPTSFPSATILLSKCAQKLRRPLEERQYTVVETPLDAFQHSGVQLAV